MRNNTVTAGLAAVFAAVWLAGCGGHGGAGTSDVRLVNATLSHPSLTLLANSSSTIGATALDTVSGYSGVSSGTTTLLQLNDATSGTALATTEPSLADGQHYAVLAYESGGTVRTALISEDTASPTSGTVLLRIFDAATDAGAVDVYVTDPSTDLSTISSPTVSFPATSSVQASTYLAFAPGTTYRIRVTGAGNTSDLRLDIPAVSLTDQQLATVILTPTVGGTLANGSVLVQQGAYTATRNTNARVRLAAAVSVGAVVSATAGTVSVADSFTAPSVGAYVLVPGGSAFTVTVGSASVAAPGAGALAVGSDATLLVYGSAAAPTVSLITDDNHLPTLTTNIKLRLLNGLTGAAAPLALEADFAVIASNTQPGTASSYAVVGASTSMRFDVTSSASETPIYSQSMINVPGNAVYTMFMLGDASAPIAMLRRDR